MNRNTWKKCFFSMLAMVLASLLFAGSAIAGGFGAAVLKGAASVAQKSLSAPINKQDPNTGVALNGEYAVNVTTQQIGENSWVFTYEITNNNPYNEITQPVINLGRLQLGGGTYIQTGLFAGFFIDILPGVKISNVTVPPPYAGTGSWGCTDTEANCLGKWLGYGTDSFYPVKSKAVISFQADGVEVGNLPAKLTSAWKDKKVPTKYPYFTDKAGNYCTNFSTVLTGPVPLKIKTDDACQVTPTISSVASGKWDDPKTWDAGRVPREWDWVSVQAGHTITMPDAPVMLGNGGLCNKGILQSPDNAFLLEVNASAVNNSGSIIGKNGAAGYCHGVHVCDEIKVGFVKIKTNCHDEPVTDQNGFPGTNVEIWASSVINTGTIQAGNGGNDNQTCVWGLPAYGGNGGSAQIFSTKTVNSGTIQFGKGGTAAGSSVKDGTDGTQKIIENLIDPTFNPDNSLIVTGKGGHLMFILPNPDPNAADIPMQTFKSLNGSYIGNNGKTNIWVIPDSTATQDSYTLITGKNLNKQGFGSAIQLTEYSKLTRSDGNTGFIFKVPEFPTATVLVTDDGSYSITDSETPSTVITGKKGGNPVVTDTEFPEMAATINPDKSLGVTHQQFPGMTYTLNPDKTRIVTDEAYPGMKAVDNGDGTLTVTDEASPGMTVIRNADGTMTVTSAEYPDVKVNFNADGTAYSINDQDGNCYNLHDAKRFKISCGFCKKLLHEASRVVSQIAGFVQKAANFVNKVATMIKSFTDKVLPTVIKFAKLTSQAAQIVSDVALFIGTIFPPLCPLACTISEFALAVKEKADEVEKYASMVSDILNKVIDYSAKISKIAGQVKDVADKVFDATRKRNPVRSKAVRSETQTCDTVTIYTASGTVTDEFGKPLSGVSVQIEDITVTTDNTGYWQIFGLSEGDYTVNFTKEGYTFNAAQITAKDDKNPEPLITKPYSDPFKAGIFTADDCGIVRIDWLYDGGKYQGEFGIFNIAGMENLTPGSPEFIAEAVKRVLSNSRQGYLVFSDLSEGARFSGLLGGEIKDWNAGPYKGVKSFPMQHGDQFATILVPNSTFAKLAENPATEDPNKRPLFSLVSQNPTYGMYFGQMADINGMGQAFAYEDKNAATSDWDFNDLIVMITHVDKVDLPTMDQLESQRVKISARQKRDGTDWRTSELGSAIMAHIEAPAPTEDTISMTVTLNTADTLLVYDPTGKVIGKDGGYVAGANFELKADGTQSITLPNLNTGSYRVAVQGAATAHSTLTVKTYQGKAEISSDQISLDIAPHQILTTNISVSDTQPPTVAPMNSATGYDFNGDGVTDDADVSMLVRHWNSCRGQQKYDAFFDVNDDGCITVADIMTVLNAKTVK